MNNITQEEYNRIMNEHEELTDLIITRTEELCFILYDRDPIGTCCDTDFDIRDDKLLVQFETSYDDHDSFLLPLEFLFSEDYRKNYKTMIEKEKYEKKQLKLQKLIEIEEKRLKIKEDHDRTEYKRLKVKYGE